MCHSAIEYPEGIIAFFLMGLAGSLHCVGMCGPISSFIFSNQTNPLPKNNIFAILRYHFGRLSGYLISGTILYLLGLPLKELISEKIFSIFILGFMIILLLTHSFQNYLLPILKINQKVMKLISKLEKNKSTYLGLSSSLLPCGLLYIAFIGSLTAPHLLEALIWIASFFIGTFPLLFISQVGYQKIQYYFKAPYRKWIQTLLGVTSIIIIIYMRI